MLKLNRFTSSMASFRTVSLLGFFLLYFTFIFTGPSDALPTALANPLDWPRFEFFPGIFGNPGAKPVTVKVEPSVPLANGGFFGMRQSKVKVPMGLYEPGILGGRVFFKKPTYIDQARITGGPSRSGDTRCGFIISEDGSVGVDFQMGQELRDVGMAWGLSCASSSN